MLKLYADVEERFPQFIGPDMILPTIAAMCEVDREEDPWLGHIGELLSGGYALGEPDNIMAIYNLSFSNQ